MPSAEGQSSEPLDPQREASLVRAAQLGSVQAFELLVRHYGGLVYRFLYLRTGNDADAKDALQETLTVAWRSLRTLRDPNSVRAWLLTIAARQAASLTRVARREPTFESDLSSEYERGFELRAAIAALPPQRRDVVLLRYFVGFSEAETAAALGISVGTVKSRAARARQAIGIYLEMSEEYE
jgi:RNA polymerase sigma factor (sigma-70 family)